MNTALQYVLKRLALLLVTMLLVSFLTFLAFASGLAVAGAEALAFAEMLKLRAGDDLEVAK